MASIFPILSEVGELAPHISAWHGFNAPLWMTIGVVVIGVLLFRFLRYWKPTL